MQEASLKASRFDLNRRIRTHSHSDGKLKGFGAVAVVRKEPERSQWGGEYRLFCGRGIKNIHVWSFKPPPGGGLVCTILTRMELRSSSWRFGTGAWKASLR